MHYFARTASKTVSPTALALSSPRQEALAAREHALAEERAAAAAAREAERLRDEVSVRGQSSAQLEATVRRA